MFLGLAQAQSWFALSYHFKDTDFLAFEKRRFALSRFHVPGEVVSSRHHSGHSACDASVDSEGTRLRTWVPAPSDGANSIDFRILKDEDTGVTACVAPFTYSLTHRHRHEESLFSRNEGPDYCNHLLGPGPVI